MGELRLERGEVLVAREVVLRLRPRGDGVDDAVDELLDAVLALRRADVAAEVLADDDVGGELAPEARDLDVLLLEDRLAGLVGDVGGPELPGDLVVRVHARARPAALERQAASALAGEARPVDAAESLAALGAPVLRGCPRLCALGCRLGVHHGDHLTKLGHLVRLLRSRTLRGPSLGLRLTCRLAVTGWGDAYCESVRRAVSSPVVPGVLRPDYRVGAEVVSGVVRRWGDRPTVRVWMASVKPKTTRCSGPMIDRIATCCNGGVGASSPPGPRSARLRPRSAASRPHRQWGLSTADLPVINRTHVLLCTVGRRTSC